MHIAKDRKSTRLNSSHRTISYTVFCLKKKMRPGKGAGPRSDAKKVRNSKLHPAPRPGCDVWVFGSRWFHHRLISAASPAQKRKDVGNDKPHGRASDTSRQRSSPKKTKQTTAPTMHIA